MGKYRVLGSLLDRVFRNNLNANFDDVDADIQVQKKRVDDLITGVPQPSEVVDARGGAPVLRDRLDGVDAQLAEKATKTEARLKAEKLVMEDMSDTVISAISGGTTVNVLSIPQDKSVTPEKTVFFGEVLNLINPDTISAEMTLVSTTGALTASTNWATSDFIPVTPSTAYHVNKRYNGSAYYGSFAFYDTNKLFISFGGEGNLGDINTPANTYYMRLAVLQKYNNVYNLLLINLNKSSVTLPPDGTKFEYNLSYVNKKYIDKDTSPVANGDKPITSGAVYNALQAPPQMGDVLNLVNPDTLSLGYGLTSGNLIASAVYNSTDFMPVDPSTAYHILKGSAAGKYFGIVAFYTSGKAFISQTAEASFNEFTTPSNAYYVRICVSGTTDGIPNIARTNLCKSTVKLPYFNPAAVYPYNKRYFGDQHIDVQGLYGWKFKYMVTFGDSNTENNQWQPQVANYFGMYHTNCGQGGSRLAGNSYTASDGQVKNPSWSDARINAIPTYADLIIYEFGTNDRGVNTVGDLSSTDTNTICGAMKTAIEKIQTRCPNTTILVNLPMWNYDENDGLLEQIRVAIRLVSDYYGLPVFESKKLLGFNYSNYTTYFSDLVHINQVGGNRKADRLIGFVKQFAPYNSKSSYES